MNLKKHISDFIESPLTLFLFFVIVNLIPSLGLVYTEPFNIWGKLVLILFPAGCYMILFSALKNIGLTQLLLIPLLVIHSFQIVIFYLFGEGVIAVDMFLNVVTTNTSEAGEVLHSIMGALIFIVVVYVPTIIIASVACKKRVHLNKRFRLKSSIIGAIVICSSVCLSLPAKNNITNQFQFYEDVYPVDVFYNLNFACHKWHRSNKYLETSKDFKFGAKKILKSDHREIYVFVIGETSRAENWSFYGYKRSTTPFLEKDSNIVLFKDVLTQSNTTHKSVSIMMSSASAENYDIIYNQKSIIEAFKEVGFSTVFLSNQSANRTFTDYFAQEADFTEYYRFFNKSVNNLDEALLPRFQHYIDSVPGNLFIVLHTYGSHFNYKERYPEKYAINKPDNVKEISKHNKEILLNAYDNTIRYTDYILSNVIKILGNTNSCATLLYASDHGEDILDDDRLRFLHASPTPTFYQLRIPMFMWFSDTYRKEFPATIANVEKNASKPISTNAVFHSILDAAKIDTKYLNRSKSLVSDKFEVKERMYLNDHDEPIPFFKTGLKKEDWVMIKKRGIAY